MKTVSLFLAVLSATAFFSMAKAPEPLKTLDQTLATASQENKMTFILLGRATCSNCNATRSMIRNGQIFVTDANYVMADLNCDDPKVNGEFMKKFGKEKFGNTLPFVVITDSQGKVLGSGWGYKGAAEWNSLLVAAKSKARKLAANSGVSSPEGSWPFSSPAPAAQ